MSTAVQELSEKAKADNILSKLSKGYWPNKGNESARIEAGNAVVDSLSVGELAVFFKNINSGPTYVLVRRHCETYPFSFDLSDKSKECEELIGQFVTEIENRKNQLVKSLMHLV